METSNVISCQEVLDSASSKECCLMSKSDCTVKHKWDKRPFRLNWRIAEDKKQKFRDGVNNYPKAYDSLSHLWMHKTLKMHIQRSFPFCSKQWFAEMQNTWLYLEETVTEIHIKTGIFQGDSLSPVLFTVAMLPLTWMSRERNCVYLISKE